MIKLTLPLSSCGEQKYHPATTTTKKTDKYEKKNTKQNRTNYTPPHAFMESTIRHNIAQIILASKVYIPCLLVIIIKWCHMITWSRHQHWWSLGITRKTYDTLHKNFFSKSDNIYSFLRIFLNGKFEFLCCDTRTWTRVNKTKRLTNQSWKVRADYSTRIY